MGGTYEFVKDASANLREKDDHWNVALGGFFSGALLGLRGEYSPGHSSSLRRTIGLIRRRFRTARTFPALLGYGAALATGMGAFEFTGGSLWGYQKNRDIDEFERRQQLRKQFRTPGEDTVSELGEGRGTFRPSEVSGSEAVTRTNPHVAGIYAPGYAERRRERIKEAYGIEVPTSPVPAS